jgi:dephospho-CoA kinase
MKLLGLTGGVGMGKSTAARLLAEMGAAVIDTDLIARKIVEPEEPALREIRDCFGADVIGPDGRLRRAELARRVFADPEARRRLEAILHPRIRGVWQSRVEGWRQADVKLAVVVIPLLFETEAAPAFDATLCVACSLATQRSRLLDRGWTGDQISQRVQAQWTIERKIGAADFVTWTEGALAIHAEQLRRIVRQVENAKP